MFEKINHFKWFLVANNYTTTIREQHSRAQFLTSQWGRSAYAKGGKFGFELQSAASNSMSNTYHLLYWQKRSGVAAVTIYSRVNLGHLALSSPAHFETVWTLTPATQLLCSPSCVCSFPVLISCCYNLLLCWFRVAIICSASQSFESIIEWTSGTSGDLLLKYQTIAGMSN